MSGSKNSIVIAATVLGVVHRKVCMLHQCLRVRPVIGIGDDPDARGKVQIVLVDAVGRAQRAEYFLRTHGRILGVCYFREQDHEFIATLPADGVRAAHAS